jgi:hypothetical protein
MQTLHNQWALYSTHNAAQFKEILRRFLDEGDRIVKRDGLVATFLIWLLAWCLSRRLANVPCCAPLAKPAKPRLSLGQTERAFVLRSTPSPELRRACSAERLAGRRGGSGELGVGRGPDARDAFAGADEERGRSECDKSHEQRVLDEILSLFVVPKVSQKRHVVSS